MFEIDPTLFAQIDWFMVAIVMGVAFAGTGWPQLRAIFANWRYRRAMARNRMTTLDRPRHLDNEIDAPEPVDWGAFGLTILPALFVAIGLPIMKALGYDTDVFWLAMLPFAAFLLYTLWVRFTAPPELRAETTLTENVLGFDLPREGWFGLIGALAITGVLIFGFAIYLA